MKYNEVLPAVFLERPNRFVARCLLGGAEVTAHVPNTGRCRELLPPRARVYLAHQPRPGRRTQYSLVAVDKGGLLINMDSQAPNRVVEEALREGRLQITRTPARLIRREFPFGASRLDFMVESEGERALLEVKGVTLEEAGEVRFPDAPTIRGLRHLEELASAVAMGWTAEVLFVVQMGRARFMAPNDETQPQFGETLRRIRKEGVALSARLCRVAPDEIILGEEIPIQL